MLKQTPKKRVLFVRRFTPVLLALFGVFSLVFTNLHSPNLAYATASNTINFQARLQTAAGAIVPDGDYNIEFKLYNASTSSGSSQGSCTSDSHCLWTETRTSANKVTVINGYLSVNLGSVTAFPTTIDWSQPLWLTMNIGGTGTATWDGEMNPRLQLTAVPYAFQAAQAGELSSTNINGTSILTFQGSGSGHGNQNFVIQDQGAAGTYNLLTKNVADSSYLQLQTSTPAAQTGSLDITGTALVGGASISGDLLMTGSSSTISNPQGSTDGEAFGANADIGATFRSTAVGNGATVTGNDSIAFGYNASTTSDESIAIGSSATCDNDGCIAIGKDASSGYSDVVIGLSASTSGNESVVIGDGSTAHFKGVAIGNGATVANNNSIAIGHGATTTDENQLVIGGSTSDGAPVSNVYIGSGVTDTTPNDVTIHATGGSGSNIAGAAMNIAGGIGTGTGNGGNINLQIAKPGSTGSSANSLSTVASLSGINGSAVFKNATDSTSGFSIQDAGGTSILGVDTTGSGTVNVSNVLSVGSAIQAPSLDTASAGTLSIGTGNATTITVGSSSSTTTTITVGQSIASNTINIGNAAVTGTQTINIGTGSTGTGKDNVTIGSTNDGSTTTINSGTGNITLNTNSSSAAVIIKSNTNSATAFQVNSSSSNIFNVDTTGSAAVSVTAGNFTVQNASGTDLLSANTGNLLINDTMTTTPTGTLSTNASYVSGQYVELNNGGPGNDGEISYTQSPVTGNFDAKFNFWSVTGGKDGTWLFVDDTAVPSSYHFGSTNGGYDFAYSDSNSDAELYFNGSLLASAPISAPNNSTWHTAEVTRNGNTFTMYYDGSAVLTFTDTARTLTGTKFGIGGCSCSQAGEHRARNFTFQSGLTSLALSGTLGVSTTSTSALQIQNGSGTNFFNVDTANEKVTIGPSGGDTTGALLVLGGKTTAGDPTEVDGAMYYNTSTETFRCGQGGIWVSCIGGLLTSNTAIASSVTNTTTETAFSKTYSLPANYCANGRTLRLTMYGTYTNNSTPSITVRTKLGSTTIATNFVSAFSGTHTSSGWSYVFYGICPNAASSSATVTGQGLMTFGGDSNQAIPYDSTTVDTTTSQTLSVTAQWSAANVSNSITLDSFILESLGP